MDFENFDEALLRHKYVYLQIFDSQTIAFLNVFEICTEMRSILYFFYVKDVLQRPF